MVVKKLKTRVARTKNLKKLIGGELSSFQDRISRRHNFGHTPSIYNTLEKYQENFETRNKFDDIMTDYNILVENQIINDSSPLSNNTLRHFWYMNWPDFGAPQSSYDISAFIKFVFDIKNDIEMRGGTTVIHCSAGVGRTGTTLIALKLFMDYKVKNMNDLLSVRQNNTDTKEKLDDAIHNARKYRLFLVQSPEQYRFLLELFNIDTSNYEQRYNQFKNQQNTFQDCKGKNRYGNILTYKNSRVKLDKNKTILESCENYINASLLSEYLNNNNVIAAQGPKDDVTISDFIHMLNQFQVKRIVMVTNLSEGNKSKCSDYLTKNEPNLITRYTNAMNKNTKTQIAILDYKNYNDFLDFQKQKSPIQRQRGTIRRKQEPLQLTEPTKKRGLFGRMWNKITRKNKPSSNA